MTELEKRANNGLERRRPRERSPSYPGVSLRIAVDRAKQLYEAERRHAAPVEAVTAAWGYTNPGSGSATVTLAALKKFGLLTEERVEGERILRLSDLALDILLNPHPEAALRRAALMPPIHGEMWNKYGTNLPSAETLRWQLVKRGFTESGVQDFLKVYRETIAFARVDEAEEPADYAGDQTLDTDDEEPQERSGPQHNPTYPRSSSAHVDAASVQQPQTMWLNSSSGSTTMGLAPTGGLRIPIPLVGGSEVIYIEGNFPLSEKAWAQFMTMINAMKPGLVRPEDQPAE